MLASFRRAVYVEVGGTVLVLVTAEAPPGPVHLRVRRAAAAASRTPMVVLTERTLAVGDVLVDLDGADGPDGSLGGGHRPLDADLLRRHADAARCSLIGADGSDLAATGDRRRPRPGAAPRRPAGAWSRLLGGRGAGLTPAGDDVLAGILVVLATAGHDETGRCRDAGLGCAHPPDLPRLPALGGAGPGASSRSTSCSPRWPGATTVAAPPAPGGGPSRSATPRARTCCSACASGSARSSG